MSVNISNIELKIMIRGKKVYQIKTKIVMPEQRDFYDNGVYIGTIAMAISGSSVYIQGYKKVIQIPFKLKKHAGLYNQTYLVRKMRELFMTALDDAQEETRQATSADCQVEEKTVKTIKAAKPKKRKFWGKIATALSVFSSMIYIWRLI